MLHVYIFFLLPLVESDGRKGVGQSVWYALVVLESCKLDGGVFLGSCC